ncbi:hypothetical protein [Streptomyces sp. NPDC020983]|uniref:hypothetical protein n=1 Tax=Streptomyces sp. NPDC020983 TaxID=3365106 RepID=UPI00379D8A9D
MVGFDQLPLLDRVSFTTTDLDKLSPVGVIDRVDGLLATGALTQIRDRELAAIQDLLAADVADSTPDPVPDNAPTAEDIAPPAPVEADSGQQAPLQDLIDAFGGRVSLTHIGSPQQADALAARLTDAPTWQDAVQALTDGAVASDQLQQAARASDAENFAIVVARWAEDWTTDQYADTDTTEWPQWARLYFARGDQAVTDREQLHTAVAAAVYPRLHDTDTTPAPGPGPATDAPTEPPPAPEQPAQEPEQHTGPSPAMARCAAVLRYYEPLLRRHKLSSRETVAFIDRPGVGFAYEPGNPLPDLIAEIGKVGERVGGSYRVSYHEWVNYDVGERRQQQSDTLTHLSIDLLTLYGGETEPLFTVDLSAILAAPPGTVIELPSEAQIEAEEAAAARIVIDHDAEGTEVRNTPRGGDQRIRDALHDRGFTWSRPQQKWYQRRSTPFEDRDRAVHGLRATFEKLGVSYTYNGPDAAPDTEESAGTAPQDTAAPAVQEASEPDTQAPEEGTAAPEAADTGAPSPDPAPAPAPAAEETTAAGGSDVQDAALPPADTEPDASSPAAGPDTPQDEPEDADAEDAEDTPRGEAGAGTVIVQTPDGPGTVIGTDDGDLVLVTTESGTRVWESGEVQWPEGTARPEDADRVVKERQNAADAVQAATAEGIELRYTDGNRLVELDVDAGHGTVVDADGAVVGWVRARIGDDGRRYWWAQDARGGAPDDMPFHEGLPPSAGVPAIRAAGSVRSGSHAVKEPPFRGPVSAEYAGREIRLTTAQVRELRRLVLDAAYSDGSPIEPPEWVGAHRKYVLNTAQMTAIRDAARAAAEAFPGVTAEERRTARVLRNAAEHLDFEVYDTARWRATIPPIGETDPYAEPYRPPVREEMASTPEAPVDAPAPAPAETSGEAAVPSRVDQPEPADAPTTAAESAPAPAAAADPVTGEPGDAEAPEEEGQLDLFAAETPETPAPARPTGRRRGGSQKEPAVHPGAEGGPDAGRLGVYGHAERGQCDRCGTPDTERYTMVWSWWNRNEYGGDMAAECGRCVELTTGLTSLEYRRLADVAESRRGGRRIEPGDRHERNGATVVRTAENEWTAVHLLSGARYRLAEESPSGYRGFVLRDLHGVSHGTGVSVSSGYELAERAALGHTPETHPNDSDDWVLSKYRIDLDNLALHEGERVTPDHPDGLRRSGAPYEHGPRWDLAVGESAYQVELLYQKGQHGDDGHRLEVTAPGRESARHVHWHGVLEWAREQTRDPQPQPTAAPVAAPLADAEEALAWAETIRASTPRTSVSSALVQAREAFDRAQASYAAGRLAAGDSHLSAARSHAILARRRESSHTDFRPLKDAIRRFHDAADQILYPGGAGWRPAVGDAVRSRHLYIPDSRGFTVQVVAVSEDGILVRSAMTGDNEQLMQPADLGPHPDLDWQNQPFRAPDEPRASEQQRRALLALPPEPGPAEVDQAGQQDETQLDLFTEAPAETAPEVAVSPEAPSPAADPSPRSTGWGLVDGENIAYRGQWDGRYEITLPGASYLLFQPSIEYRRTKFAVSLNDQPPGTTPRRLRRFDDPDEIMPWVRAHASKNQTSGWTFRDGAWAEMPASVAKPVTEVAAEQDRQLPLLGDTDAVAPPLAPAADTLPEETATAEPVADAATQDEAPGPERQADPGEAEPTIDRGDMTTPPSTTDTDDTVAVEEPPEPQPFTDITTLAADPGYELHLTGVDGQAPTAGELRYGGATIADVRLSASGRWFARMSIDGMPADVTALTGSPQDAAHQGATMFAVFTSTPYGEPPQAAAADGPLSRADRLRADLRDAAQVHLDAITAAASRVRANYPQIPQFQELNTRLAGLSAAVAEGHNSRQMTANLTAVQEAVNAWGEALPTDAALDERQFLAWPLAHLLYDATRLHGRIQATLDAVQAERAQAEREAAAAAVEPVAAREAAVVQQPQPDPSAEPAREAVRGPVVTLSLRVAGDGGVAAQVEMGEIAHVAVLPGVAAVDLPALSLPTTAELPMLVRPAGGEGQLLGDEETGRWLARHLDRDPLSPAWTNTAVRAALVVVVRDALRDQAAPSVDDIADWLVETATEHGDLLLAAHTVGSVEAFAPVFARAADAQVTADGGEHLVWRYFWSDDGAQRDAVLDRAVERAHERLLAEDAPAVAPAPEQAAAAQATEPAAPRPDAPKDPEMATPAHPATPENREAADPAPPTAPAGAEPGKGQPARAEAESPTAAEPVGDLPLWADPMDAPEPAADRPLDVVGDFAAVQEAWDEHIPAGNGTGADLFASVEEDLVRLEALFAEVVASRAPAVTPEPQAAPEAAPASGPAPADAEQPAPPPPPAEPKATTKDRDPQQRADAVNTALREADTHAPTLRDMPEWQRIQTVRGAFGNLARVIAERAGEHLNNLLADGRLGDYLRRVSIRVCETIAKWAQAGADWLRKGGQRDADGRGELPSAEALLRLGDATMDYRGPRRGPSADGADPASPAAAQASTVVDVPAMRAMGEALNRPMPGATKRVSTAAARGRSTTAKRVAKKTASGTASGAEQPGHLRRPGTEQPQAPKPTR